MKYCIIDASARHIPSLEAIERECFSLPWTEAQLAGQMPDETHIFLVAEGEDKDVLGYVGMQHILDEGYISNVAVAKQFRRRGLASALINELLLRADDMMLSFVTLEVRASNIPARTLYKKFGFKDVGERKNYYQYPSESAILMTINLK